MLIAHSGTVVIQNHFKSRHFSIELFNRHFTSFRFQDSALYGRKVAITEIGRRSSSDLHWTISIVGSFLSNALQRQRGCFCVLPEMYGRSTSSLVQHLDLFLLTVHRPIRSRTTTVIVHRKRRHSDASRPHWLERGKARLPSQRTIRRSESLSILDLSTRFRGRLRIAFL